MKHGMTVYQYILTHQGKSSLIQFFGMDPMGVCHGDDLMYLFETMILKEPLTGDDVLVRDEMVSAWSNFAIHGNPTPPGSDLSWSPAEPNNVHQLFDISGPRPIMSTSPEIKKRMALWDNIM